MSAEKIEEQINCNKPHKFIQRLMQNPKYGIYRHSNGYYTMNTNKDIKNNK